MIHLVFRISLVFATVLVKGAARVTHNGGQVTITIAADIWCPVNCDPSGEKMGFGVDLTRRIFEPLGYTVHYRVMPWARALSKVRAGDVDAVIGANYSDDKNLIFPKTPLAPVADDFYALKDSEIIFDGVKSLQGLRIGVIHSYGYSDDTNKLLSAGRLTPGLIQEISGEKALEQNIKKLLTRRIDVMVENGIIMQEKLRVENLQDKIIRIGTIPQGGTYLAFSNALPYSRDLAKKFDDGVRRLRATGELNALYVQYGMTP